ncbi:dihydrodipicolinate synthase family protein [Ramlibacter monticola]|uniref:Dihydrodipicolinate synthase family protein n=1 Tax=Ramlibacter monticola TaxID=1926872 RepID=A0A936Z4J3_9BURK|nr:dihydrodipicolinate synthase family protein [Ramlibacter monticola]MBL0395000.1 dihydrodipicolinate synthase family protein [Ramlibacter monticola]
MPLNRSDLPREVLQLLADGAVIPAHPLALDARRQFDRRRQRALTRYYVDAGAGGLAVGVHTTQFAIREHGLYERVLASAMEDRLAWSDRPMAMIAGLCGRTEQARREARIAVGLGYHAGLLSLAALASASEDERIAHCEAVAQEIPLVGFYLQTAVGGPTLPHSFWRRFASLPNALAIKVAPFHRYRTLDVVRGLVDAGAEERVYLYTGNDDHIVLDLALPFTAMRDGRPVTVRFRGGLLGHWSVWTAKAVEQLEAIKAAIATHGGSLPPQLLALDSRVTDCNSAFFDVRNDFHGCIAGCHEVLRRQGLLEGIWCLDPQEGLGAGQPQEIDRVLREHADLADDAFVRANLERWLS